MGLLNKLTEKYNCDICGKTENKLLMQVLKDGRVCQECFDKLGKGKFTTTYSLEEAYAKIINLQSISTKEKSATHISQLKKVRYKLNLIKPSDLESLDDITRIETTGHPPLFDGEFTDHIIYILQKKATQHKKNNNMACAVACLEKAYNIMKNSPNCYYGDYAQRYVDYLKKDRQFEKARDVQKQIDMQNNAIIKKSHEAYYTQAKDLGTDLVEADYPEICSGTVAKYRGRIYSLTGKDKRFPFLSQEIKSTGLYFNPFIYGISSPNYCKHGDEINFSNRPFVDDRSPSEKEKYKLKMKTIEMNKLNRIEYDWIWENMPDISPRSLNGYVRMKNSNSKNYQKLKDAAAKKGYTLK